MSWPRFLVFTIALVSLVAACPGHNNVECRDDTSCDLSPGGTCIAAATANQWCAYPDPACPSGYRFSDQDVGDDLGGTCTEGGPGNFTLSFTVGGNGTGVVSSSPEGLNCTSGTCMGTFPEGTVVELTATATTGVFLGWSDACQGQTACFVMMDQDRSVGALFGVPGEALWVKQLGTSGVDTGFGLVVDGDDNVIAVGQFSGAVTLGRPP